MRKYINFRRGIMALLALVMLLAPLLAVEAPARAEALDAVSVTVSLADETGYPVVPSEYTVREGLAGDYGYTAGVDGVTVLDAAVRLHEAVYGEDIHDALAVSDGGWVSRFMGRDGFDIVCLVNGVLGEDLYGETEISDGDRVEFFFMRDTDYYLDTYAWFAQGGQRTEALTATAGEALTLSLEGVWGVAYGDYGAVDIDVDGADIVLMEVESGDEGWAYETAVFGDVLGTTDDDGLVTLQFDEPGTYVLSAREADEQYYLMAPWCVVTVEADGGEEEEFGWQGAGTEEDPFQVHTAADLELIRERVADGTTFSDMHFALQRDITLPDDWTPIGDLGAGATGEGAGVNILPFSGVIDGGGHTLTYPDHGEHALIRYARGAAVKNLVVSGTYIDCYAIVESYVVDYGPTGNYSTYTQNGTVYPVTVEMDNITIASGTSTLYAGLIGGDASGANAVVIRNCTAEEGVVIGYDGSQSDIGTFAGRVNGTVEGCVSYATVCGVDGVGGLVGAKGQAMGDFAVTNSAFLGEIAATGSRVGGIAGRGYVSASAPSTPLVTVRDCYVDAEISGVDKVGGILGDDSGNRGTADKDQVTDNHFFGTVTATGDNVGGIVGYYYRYENATGNNNFFRVGCGAEMGIGGCSEDGEIVNPERFATPATEGEFADGTVLAGLNSSETGGNNWVQGERYPVLGGGAVPSRLTLSGRYQTVYYVGDSFSTEGMTLTVTYSDGTQVEIGPEEATFTGYDLSTTGTQTVTVNYGGLETGYTIQVLQRDSGGGGGGGTITVQFTLLGAEKHGGQGETQTLAAGNLQTWIPRTTYTVDLNATALDVFQLALTGAGLTWENSGGYVEAVTYNGITLAELDNGPLSGWMYTLNGDYTRYSMDEQYLQSGDSIVFHYTDDYTMESGWTGEEGGSGGDSGSGGGSGNEQREVTATAQVEAVLAGDGTATATLEGEAAADFARAITESGDETGSVAEIVVDVPDGVDSLTFTLPSLVTDALAGTENTGLELATDLGALTFDPAAVAAITGAADGGAVTFAIARLEPELPEGMTGEARMRYDLTVSVDGVAVADFGGGRVEVLLPCAPAAEELPILLSVWHIDGEHADRVEDGAYNEGRGGMVFTTEHFSRFAVAYGVQRFDDVPSGHWAFAYIGALAELGLVDGRTADTYAPGGEITRAEFVTVLARMSGDDLTETDSRFTDVAATSWYAPYVAWAERTGVTTGVSETAFAPDASITRQEMAAMLMRFAEDREIQLPETVEAAQFADSGDIASWATEAVEAMQRAGILEGRGDNQFAPREHATRAEAAKVFWLVVELAE